MRVKRKSRESATNTDAALTKPIDKVLNMAKRIVPTPEQLRNLLSYEAETGKLYWKPRPYEMFKNKQAHGTWNTRYAGKESFTAIGNHGYHTGSVNNKMYTAHRVIWAIAHGEWPRDQIDHINGLRTDNRISNLREATAQENNRNIGLGAANTSGYKGVCWHAYTKKWKAEIKISTDKRLHLGLFETPEAAHAAYCSAATKYHGDFARLE